MLTCLRCYKCNFEFIKDISVEDKIYEFICPSCNKDSIELNIGRKVKNFIELNQKVNSPKKPR